MRTFLAKFGLPREATRGQLMKVAGFNLEPLYKQAGITPAPDSAMIQFATTMDSQRLGWYAATVDPLKGEKFWRATSRRYFEGKDTNITPIRLDSRDMLLECAREADIDEVEAMKILDSDKHRDDILKNVEAMHDVGIHAIPVLIFEVDGVSHGSWLEDPRAPWDDDDPDPRHRAKRAKAEQECPGRQIHHGSGSKQAFKNIFLKLHAVCAESLA